MRAAFFLVLLAGCENDVAPPPVESSSAPAPAEAAPPPSEAVPTERLDVTVLEYGTEKPIVGAMIVLVRDKLCNHTDPATCPQPTHKVLKSDAAGLHVELAVPEWRVWLVESISAPGYATECPSEADWFDLHDLAQEHTTTNEQGLVTAEQYTCHLIAPSAISIRDEKAAIEAAKATLEVQDWLRMHRNARVSAYQEEMSWSVWFVARGVRKERQLVTVNAFDGMALPSDMLDSDASFAP